MGQAVRPAQPPNGLLVQEQSVTVQVQLPPPEMLRQYDTVRPGTSDLLIRWNEEEQAHRRRMEVEALQANIDAQRRQLDLTEQQVKAQSDALRYQSKTVRLSDSIGQLQGWLLCVAAIFGAIYLALQGHTAVACVLAAMPTAALVQSFRTLLRQDARGTDKP